MPEGNYLGHVIPKDSIGPFADTYQLLDGAAATENGTWIRTETLKYASVEIFGTFVGSIQLCGTNQLSPASNYDGFAFGSVVTAPGQAVLTMPCRWVKAKVTAYTSGALSAILHGVG